MLLRRSRSARRHGVTIVESAFVLSIALLMVFSILEYARYLMVLQVTNNAARSAARYAVVNTGNGTTQAQILSLVDSNMGGVQTNITGYTRTVFTVNPSGIYNTSTNTYNYPPTLQAEPGSNWNDATYGNGICVQITGTYYPVVSAIPFLNKFNMPILSPTPITVNSVMNSEAN